MKKQILCLGLALGPLLWGNQTNGLQIEVVEASGTIEARMDGEAILTYRMTDVPVPVSIDPVYQGNGFIYPLRSPSGQVLSEAYPAGHAHQHSLFNAWTRTTFHGSTVDFWNVHRGSGYTEHAEFLGLLAAGEKQGFKARREQVSREHGVALSETWEVLVHPSRDPFIFDVSITQRTATREPLVMEEYHYGGFAYRGAPEWNDDDTERFQSPMRVLTPETESLEEANHSRPRWVAGYGELAGEWAGVAILDHRENFRYPQPVRVHPRMPYFVFSPPVLGPFTLEPGFQLVSRYRVVLFDGKPNPDQVEAWFEDFNEPAPPSLSP